MKWNSAVTGPASPDAKLETADVGPDRPLGSDLAKVDAHVVAPEEYEEIPELTDEMLERADYYEGAKLVRRGGAGMP